MRTISHWSFITRTQAHSLIQSRNADLGVIVCKNYEFQLHPSRLASSLLHSERISHRVRYICKAKKESNHEMVYCTGSTNVLEVGFGQFFIFCARH